MISTDATWHLTWHSELFLVRWAEQRKVQLPGMKIVSQGVRESAGRGKDVNVLGTDP